MGMLEDLYKANAYLKGQMDNFIPSTYYFQGKLVKGLGHIDGAWVRQDKDTISLPDYIRLSAKGKAKMEDGYVWLHEDYYLKG